MEKATTLEAASHNVAEMQGSRNSTEAVNISYIEGRKDFQSSRREALDKCAKKVVKVLAAGSTANNSNALYLFIPSPIHSKIKLTGKTKLHQSKAQAALAPRIGVSVDKVENVMSWGNYSSTHYPDVARATVEKGLEINSHVLTKLDIMTKKLKEECRILKPHIQIITSLLK
ncbi:hypothetical protein TKK_0015308 [Trichogramma kaykai]